MSQTRHVRLSSYNRSRRDWLVVPRAAGRFVRWSAKAPAERFTLPAAAVAWTSGPILHAVSVPAIGAGAGGIIATLATYAVVLQRSHGKVTAKDDGPDRDMAAWRAGKAAIGMFVAGSYVTLAAAWGAFAGPYGMLSWTYLVLAGAGYLLVRHDELVSAKRDWRNEKLAWIRDAPLYGLQGSHLQHSETTRLGKRMLVDTRGTGRRASSIGSSHTAELIAEHKRLPVSRVQITPDRIAGRIWISIRTRDPWAHPIPHPVLDSAPEIQLPERQSITDPLIVGQDPESGKPLSIVLYDAEDGANGMLIVGLTGAGKSVLLNDIRERLTACDNVLIWDINLSKAKEDRAWAESFDLKAHGPKERRNALAILRLAIKVIEYRGMSDSDDAVHVPTPEDPAIVLMVDEADALQGDSDYLSQAIKGVLAKINSKKRSEGLVLIEAAQRGVVTHTGNADIRANFNTFALGMVRGRSELLNAAGDLGMDVPDMTTYGEGHKGVWLLASLGGDYQTGRTFKLKDLGDLRKIASERPPTATLPIGLREYLGDNYERLKTGQVTAHQVSDEPAREPFLDDLEKELRTDMDEDLLDQMDKLAARNTAIGREQAALDAQELTEVVPEHEETLRAGQAERWRQAVATIDIPAELAATILSLARDGVATRELMGRLNLPKTTVWEYMAKLRVEGLVISAGKGRNARWFARNHDAQADGG